MSIKTALLLHHGGDGIRGTEICLIQSARALAGSGWRVVVCRNQPVMDVELATIPVAPRVLPLEFPELRLDGKDTAFPLVAYVRAVRALRRLVLELRPDVIYCSGGLPCQTAVPVGRMMRIPVLCHFHHPAIRREYFLWLVKFADKVVFPSEFTRSLSRRKARIEGEVIYNGIDVERFQPTAQRDPSWRQRLGIDARAVVIGQVGALVDHKRPGMLLRAFARIRAAAAHPLHLCVVGKGPLLEPLEALARELDIRTRVSLVGSVPDVLPFYQHVLDINALVSREEGLGLAVIEGSACGLPALVTDCTGLSETVIPERTGLRFGLHDEAALDAHLLRLANDATLRHRLGAAGREHARQTFAAETYGRKIVAAAESLVRWQPQPAPTV